MPFSNPELFHVNGYYYGVNQRSQNLIYCDRLQFKTPSGFILGSSGSGKSFATKREILNVLFQNAKTSVIVIDPEKEYTNFTQAMNGTVIEISAYSDNRLNPLDLPLDYGFDDDIEESGEDEDIIVDVTYDDKTKQEKAIKNKADYIMSIIEAMISHGNKYESIITPQQKTLVDRCVKKVYQKYADYNFDSQYIPTLLDLQYELDSEAVNEYGQANEDARLIAEGVEYYTKGSQNIFAHKSNVDYNNRFVTFTIRDLGTQLKQISLLIVLDFIWTRMIENFQKGQRTYVYVDEIHVLFQNEYSARFLQQLYKRGRKYGLVITGITQNMEDLLRSETARGMINNSDFVMMLNQARDDLKLLSDTLKISEALQVYVSQSEKGSGLLFAENTIIPFMDKFPEDSYLYKLITTKFGETDQKELNKIISTAKSEMEERNLQAALT